MGRFLALLGPPSTLCFRALSRGIADIKRDPHVDDGFHDARRHEGERGELSDVPFDLVLASGDLLELSSRARDVAVHREAKSLMRKTSRRCAHDNAR